MALGKYYNNVTDQAGNAIVGASVYVYITGTTTAANLFEDDESTALANPVTTDAYGEFSFNAAAGTYDLLIVSGTDSISRTKIAVGIA